jgi:hypothetical protein
MPSSSKRYAFEFVMHLPEFALNSGGLSGFRSPKGMRMRLHRWEVSKDKIEMILQQSLNLFNHGYARPQ